MIAKQRLKSMAAWLARTQVVRSIVGNLIYPTVVRCLHAEFQPDIVSPSGLAEAFAWKTHSYIVLYEELRPSGRDCAWDGMCCDNETRARLIDTVQTKASRTEGDILEFGVYNGESLRVFAERFPERRVYGFDSFQGLPEAWWTRPHGTFKTEVPQFDKPNVTLVKGLFDHTLPLFLAEWEGRPSIIHVDCDLYSSTLSCLIPIIPRCQVGTVILFDEYYNYPDFAQHEWLAWREVRSRCGIIAPCIAYDGRRAAFQITHMGHSES